MLHPVCLLVMSVLELVCALQTVHDREDIILAIVKVDIIV